jgi:dipeptidyl aminopeptidase/acylaminoacyl peptidase
MNRTIRVAIYVSVLMSLSHFASGEGLRRDYFLLENHKAFVLHPPKPAARAIPWIWYAPTFSSSQSPQATDWLFEKLLDGGMAVAGIDVGESYGSPAGRKAYNDFYDYATRRANLAAKVCLLAQSRGGLMLYNWAVENARKVRCIVGIYPVCDLRSYPGLEKAAPAYGMTLEELGPNLLEHNPIDRLEPLAKKRIPIFHIHGDNDVVVPLARNSQVVYDRYRALGGQMELIVVPGKGHAEIPEFFHSSQLLNFLLAHK